jgi:hypothetical protein
LLIDNSVDQHNIFFNSTNNNTLPIIYNYSSDSDELYGFLENNFISIDRIGIVFNDSFLDNKLFLNKKSFFNQNDIIIEQTEFSESVKFIISLINKFKVKNLDFLGCNTLNNENWIKYYKLLEKETTVIVGASDNKTGNIKYGGDWILESSGEDIKSIYWTDVINNYSQTLATSTISVSTVITNEELNNPSLYTWPITINGGTINNPVVITFGDDITLNTTSKFFIINSNFITIDGNDKIVFIDGVQDYPGLFNNGTNNTNGFSNILINNFDLKVLNSPTLVISSGWFCQRFYARGATNCLLNNLKSNGNLNIERNGGIVGQDCAIDFGNLIITNCSSTGDISAFGAGGICSSNVALFGGSVLIENSYSAGNISGNQAGGITSFQPGEQNGLVSIKNCYSTGDISAFDAGGICSSFAGFNGGSVTIENCYSTGKISGNQSGGIISLGGGEENGSVSIQNFYSTGDISGEASGGITGSYFGYNTNKLCKIENCYSTGNIVGSNAGGISGALIGYNDNIIYIPQVVIINCYSLGTISDQGGSICGGTRPVSNTYTNIPNVNVQNCYSLNEPIISVNLPIIPITPTVTNCGTSNGIWLDSTANTYLVFGPTYSVNGRLINPIGQVWTDIDAKSNNIPWLFSIFGQSPYTNIPTNTFEQSLNSGHSTIKAIQQTGCEYSIIAINNKIETKFFKINSSNGLISTDIFTPSGSYDLKIYQLFSNNTYSLTDFNLILKNILPNIGYYQTKTCINTKIKIPLSKIIPKYLVFNKNILNVCKYVILNKPKHGKAFIVKKNILEYIPNNGYTGKDKLTVGLINTNCNIGEEIDIYICVVRC